MTRQLFAPRKVPAAPVPELVRMEPTRYQHGPDRECLSSTSKAFSLALYCQIYDYSQIAESELKAAGIIPTRHTITAFVLSLIRQDAATARALNPEAATEMYSVMLNLAEPVIRYAIQGGFVLCPPEPESPKA